MSNHTILGGNDNVSTNSYSILNITPATGATSYQWSVLPANDTGNCDTAGGLTPPGVIYPTVVDNGSYSKRINWGNCPGYYKVRCIATNSCAIQYYSDKRVTVFGAGGGGNPCGRAIAVTPNPIKGDGTITVNIIQPVDPPCDNNKSAQVIIENIAVYDLKSNMVYSNKFKSNSITLNDLKLKKGLYIVQATTNDKERLITLYISLGIVETETKNFKKAIEYFNLSLSEQNKSNSKANEINKAFNYFNLGEVYFKSGNVKKALNYAEFALNCESLREKDSKLYCLVLSSYAFYKMKLKDYNQLPHLFNVAIRVSDSLNYFKGSFFTRLEISEFYAIQKDTLLAQKYADEALKIARKSKVPYNILNGLRQVGVVNKNKASNAIDEYDKRIDSLLAEERKTRNQFYKIQLETDEITQQKEFAVKQNGKTMLIMTGILCIVILLFVIYRQSTKQKELKLLQSQQNANEELYQLLLNQQNKEEEIRVTEKKRIAQELHDGVMNRLAGTRINLFILTRNRDEETINKCIGYIQDIHAIENEIRNIAHDLKQ